MKNPKRKPVFVVLLKDGKPEFGDLVHHEVYTRGKLGFTVRGLVRTLWNADKGKTWRQAQE